MQGKLIISNNEIEGIRIKWIINDKFNYTFKFSIINLVIVRIILLLNNMQLSIISNIPLNYEYNSYNHTHIAINITFDNEHNF